MASGVAADLVTRMIGDAAFRAAVRQDPTAALAGYDLTDEERRALAGDGGSPDIRVGARVTKRRVGWSDRDAKIRWTPAK